MFSKKLICKNIKFKIFIFLGMLWLVAVFSSVYIFGIYENTPGNIGNVQKAWPSYSKIKKIPESINILIFLHPRCSCSIASVEALDIIRSRCHNDLNIIAILYKPENFSAAWEKTTMLTKLRNIPKIKIYYDIDGREARTFGATTSGSVFLYSNDILEFYGGITISRGHLDSGDNFGIQTIVNYVDHGSLLTTTTPVFGCSIFNKE